MGYTHHFSYGKIPLSKWEKITKDIKTLLKNLPEHSLSSGGYFPNVPIVLKYEWNKKGRPLVDIDTVRFNGEGDMGHETFFVERIPHDYEGKRTTRANKFCKTARKPYDLAVQGCLLVFRHYLGKAFDLRSDGDNEEWQVAVEWVESVLDIKIKTPVFAE